MIAVLLSFLINLSYIWGIRLRYAPFSGIIEKPLRRKLLHIYIGILLVNFVLLTLSIHAYGISTRTIQLNGFLIAAIVVLTNRKLVTGRWKEHLFVFGIVESCSFLILSIPILLVDLWGGFNGNMSYLTGLVIYDLLFLALYRPIRNLLCSTVEPFLSLDTGNYWKLVWFLPVGIYFGMIFNSWSDIDSMSLHRLISRTFLSVTMLMLCLSIANDHQYMAAEARTREQLLDQKVHYAQLQNQVELARKNAHNYMHHIAAIRNLTEQGDLDSLRKYCDELTEEYGFREHIPYSGNPAADGVIYRYIKLARENNVTLQYQGRIAGGAISDLDLCVLLGNALENALTGCLTIDYDRQIRIIAQQEGGLLSILVTNTFDGVVRTSGDVFLSRKRSNAPGLGMESMREICTRCGGTMQTKWTDDRFTVLFLFPIS